jgi:hypothetical protein
LRQYAGLPSWIEGPARERTALSDDHAAPTAVGHDDRGRDGVRLVLQVEHRVLAQTTHATEKELRVAGDELRPPGEVGVEALDAAIVERQHLVLEDWEIRARQLVTGSRVHRRNHLLAGRQATPIVPERLVRSITPSR